MYSGAHVIIIQVKQKNREGREEGRKQKRNEGRKEVGRKE
jgi:hypothetical protein